MVGATPRPAASRSKSGAFANPQFATAASRNHVATGETTGLIDLDTQPDACRLLSIALSSKIPSDPIRSTPLFYCLADTAVLG